LLTEVPFYFRTPDLTVFRCLGDASRGLWRGKPTAADTVIVVEVVSPGSRSEDTYATEQVTFRKKDLLAVDTLDPFEVTLSWEQLDEWL